MSLSPSLPPRDQRIVTATSQLGGTEGRLSVNQAACHLESCLQLHLMALQLHLYSTLAHSRHFTNAPPISPSRSATGAAEEVSYCPHLTKSHVFLTDESLEPSGTFHGSMRLFTNRKSPYLQGSGQLWVNEQVQHPCLLPPLPAESAVWDPGTGLSSGFKHTAPLTAGGQQGLG